MMFFLLFSIQSFGQAYDRLNPPYPRTAMFNMADPTISVMDGVRWEMLKNYNMVMIYGMEDYGGSQLAQMLKDRNPNQIIIASGINSVNERDPVDFFLYRSYRGILTQDISPNDGVIKVSTTSKILSGQTSTSLCFIVINGDLIKVNTIVDDTTLEVVTDNADRYVVSANHSVGDTVYSALRVAGPGMYPNYSQYTQMVNGQYVWDYVAEENLIRECNWASGLFDGMFHDWFSYNFGVGTVEFDFDRNGVYDLDEHSETWMNAQWRYGLELFIQKEIELMNQQNPDGANLLGVNAGGGINGFYEYLNGHQFEGFQRFSTWNGLKTDAIEWMNNGQEPTIMSILDYFPEKHFYNGKNRFYNIRFGLTTAMMFDMYYGYSAGDTYWLFYWYDEFETNLGYPTGPYSTLPNGLLVRYFDNGAAVCNPTGADQTLTADMLTGGPFYRFQGGQDTTMNNGQILTSVSLYGYDYGDKNLRGDGILLFYEPTTSICDIIVDNFNLNATSPGSAPVILSGDWNKGVSSAQSDFSQSNPYWGLDGSRRVVYTDKYTYDEGYGFHYATPGDGSYTATWRPTIGVEGWYEVSEWHGWYGTSATSSDEATNVPFEIGSGAQVRLRGVINQQENYGQWNRLGYVYLTPGTDGYVQINNNANGFVLADAMKFKYMGDESFTPDDTPPATPTNVQVY